MENAIDHVDILIRREIEALMAGPILAAFAEELGWERVERIVEPIIAGLAREAGHNLREAVGGDSLIDLAAGLEAWSRNGALEIELLEKRAGRLAYNVTRCRYAEMYRRLGLEDLGFLLSCGRDLHLVTGFNPAVRMDRTQTIMQGGAYCDFRFTHVAGTETGSARHGIKPVRS